MSRSQFAILAVVTATAGLIGGAISPYLSVGGRVVAQDRALPIMKDPKPSKGKVFRAKSFILVDDDGKKLAELGSETEHDMGQRAMLKLFDGSGKDRVVIFAADKATGIEMLDADGKSRFVLSDNAVGMSSSRCQFLMNDAEGKPRVKFDLSSFGAMTALVSNGAGAGIELVASVFKEKPLFRLLGKGGGQVWEAQ